MQLLDLDEDAKVRVRGGKLGVISCYCRRGAIAYSASTALDGAVSARATESDARAAALQMCSSFAGDCVDAVSYRHGCGVVKRDPATGGWGAGQAAGNGMPAINAAGSIARVYCVQGGSQGCGSQWET